MTLGEKQELFARLLPRLLSKAHLLGYEVRLQELRRGTVQAEWNANHCAICGGNVSMHTAAHEFRAVGIANSLHCDGLAIDLYIRRPGGRLLWATEHYRELGEFWEAAHELCAWGGRFGDGGHFSIMHGGRK